MTGWLKISEESRHELIEILSRTFSGPLRETTKSLRLASFLVKIRTEHLAETSPCVTAALFYSVKWLIYTTFTQIKIDQIEFIFSRSAGRVYCCRPSAAQSSLVSGPVGIQGHIFVLSKTLGFSEMGPPLRREEGSVYYWALTLLGVTQAGAH
jgi:hypothetical protein